MKEDSIILLLGRICSGKSSFQSTTAYRITVSNIVRDLVKSHDRDVLQNTIHLDERISKEILNCLDALTTAIRYNLIEDKTIIVDGIRQSTIVDQVLSQYPHSNLVWLEVPANTRKLRYEKRHAHKDREAFDVADNKPIELECQRIYDNYKEQLQVIYNG